MKTLNSINDLKKVEGPKFILFMGPPGAGKSTLAYKHFYNLYPILDIDTLLKNNTNQEISDGLNFIKTTSNILLKNQDSFVNVSTSKNFSGLLNKLINAKEYNFNTFIIYVESKFSVLCNRVRYRVEDGGHGEKLSNQDIQSIHRQSKTNFKLLTSNVRNISKYHTKVLNAKQMDSNDIKKLVDFNINLKT